MSALQSYGAAIAYSRTYSPVLNNALIGNWPPPASDDSPSYLLDYRLHETVLAADGWKYC
jgi:hypothetical protein